MREIMLWLMIKYPDGMEQHRNGSGGWMPQYILDKMNKQVRGTGIEVYDVFRYSMCGTLAYYNLKTGLTEKGWKYIRKEVEETADVTL